MDYSNLVILLSYSILFKDVIKSNEWSKAIYSYLCQRLQYVFHNWTKTPTKSKINELKLQDRILINSDILSMLVSWASKYSKRIPLNMLSWWKYNSDNFRCLLLWQIVRYQVKKHELFKLSYLVLYSLWTMSNIYHTECEISARCSSYGLQREIHLISSLIWIQLYFVWNICFTISV